MNNYNNFSKGTKAVALGYNEKTDVAPKILASGNNLIADQILDIARKNNIPIHYDADLVKTLSILEINSYIPLEVYGVVAKIISHIYEKNNQVKNKYTK